MTLVQSWTERFELITELLFSYKLYMSRNKQANMLNGNE